MSETSEVNPIVIIENQFGEVQLNLPKEVLQNIQSSYRLNSKKTTYNSHKW